MSFKSFVIILAISIKIVISIYNKQMIYRTLIYTCIQHQPDRTGVCNHDIRDVKFHSEFFLHNDLGFTYTCMYYLIISICNYMYVRIILSLIVGHCITNACVLNCLLSNV